MKNQISHAVCWLVLMFVLGCAENDSQTDRLPTDFELGDEQQIDSSVELAEAGSLGLQQREFTSVQGEIIAVPVTDAKATVLIFVSSTCPIANGYTPEINRLNTQYKPRGIEFCLVHTESDLTMEAAEEHLQQFGYECSVLLDPQRELVELTGATITPEVAVLSPTSELLYRGRIDDRFPGIGIQKATAAKTELRDALDAIIAGMPIAIARTKAVGCFIE